MPKTSFLVLPFVLAATIASAQMGSVSSEPEPNFKDAVVGSPLICSQPHTLVIPSRLLEKARVKARLLTLLRESLFDDASGFLNIAR